MRTYRQPPLLNLAPNTKDADGMIKIECLDKATIIHEAMHIIGLFHEHQRKDRNKYVIFHRDNIIKGIYS